MEDDTISQRYYLELAAAFVRGRLGPIASDALGLFRAGRKAGLSLHKFKRTSLPRVQKVIGLLTGLSPRTVLDIGSGRGAFLWPLLHTLRVIQVDAVDVSEQRVSDINAVRDGGIDRVKAHRMDVTRLGFDDDQFDITCALEVLEHLKDPHAACREILRVSTSYAIISVPSKPDDNEAHIQLFDHETMTQMVMNAGARAVDISYVRGHLIAFARI